jgi:hypothetical protein
MREAVPHKGKAVYASRKVAGLSLYIIDNGQLGPSWFRPGCGSHADSFLHIRLREA